MSLSLISEQATVHALNLQDGKERWQVQLQNNQVLGTEVSLTLTEQALYVLQSSLEEPGQLVALRPQDGVQIWSATSEADQKILMASHEMLYLANPWELDAFQSFNGKHLWSQRFGGTANSIVGSSQHGIFETRDAASFCSLDLTKGTARWCMQLSLLEWDGTPFFIDQTTIYLFSDGNHIHPDDNHDLYVVDKPTGKERTHFTIHSLTGAITAL
jgi:outer membrane protein assembly factor BamB